MNIPNDQYIIAGPCSAESREQVLNTAAAIHSIHNDSIFRAGIWKPRTKPNSFDGVGVKGLQWLKEVKEQYQLKTATEVASPYHVEECLKNDVDVLWIGARSTGNPFSVQAIADALRGTDQLVMVKNPIHADVNLWIGAFERLEKNGIKNAVGIHRGFHYDGLSSFRNEPKWDVLSQFRSLMPQTKLICDVSHIAGNSMLVPMVAEQAMQQNVDGLMIETHQSPDQALSDAKQQVKPEELKKLLNWIYRSIYELDSLRKEIDQTDDQLIALLGRRMKIAQKIAHSKKQHELDSLQPERWKKVQYNNKSLAHKYELNSQFVHQLYELIHRESLQVQNKLN